MAGRKGKKGTQQKQTAQSFKNSQLVLKQAAKKSTENLEAENNSFNISQIEPKENNNKIDTNTLASSYFSSPNKNERSQKNTKVSKKTDTINFAL